MFGICLEVPEPTDPTFDDALPCGRARGRGAGLSPANRFDRITLSVRGEALDEAMREHPNGVQIPTTTITDASRTVINRVDSPDLGFKWTINPYRGCEHGCIYCYARPTHEMLGLSCGLDFETKIHVKHDAPELLRRELAQPAWKGEAITMSGVTDAYQPLERTLKITRRCLKVVAEANQPVFIVTKNALVTRDADHLSQLAAVGAAGVAISVTTLDPTLAAVMEPRASSPAARLKAIQTLHEHGIPVMVMMAPIVPGLTDHEAPAVLEAAKDAGATAANWVMLRLPHQVKDLFLDWLERNMPRRAHKVEQLIRQVRGGELSDAKFGSRLRGEGPLATQISQLFSVCRAKLGLASSLPALNAAAFQRPSVPLHDAAPKPRRRPGRQLGLFD